MALNTFSIFYYGFDITSNTQFINFDEGSGELSASVAIQSYTLTDLLTAIKTSLDSVGTQTYTVSVNRQTRIVTISAASNFDLLVSTGSQAGASPFELLGFTGSTDLTGQNSYSGQSPAGSFYEPQFKLQDYNDQNKDQTKIDASVNESASGDIEVISFGTRKIINASFKYITDVTPQDGYVIKNNSNGISDAESFFQFLIEKKPLEFMPDINDRNTFIKVLLEGTNNNRDGTGYKLTELVGQGLPGYYEINNVKFRVIE